MIDQGLVDEDDLDKESHEMREEEKLDLEELNFERPKEEELEKKNFQTSFFSKVNKNAANMDKDEMLRVGIV